MSLFSRLCLHILFLLSATAYSSALQISSYGVVNGGMASTFTTSTLSAEISWLNPAAMSMIEKRINVTAGLNALLQTTKFQYQEPSMYQAITENPHRFPYHFFSVIQINNRWSAGFSTHNAGSERIQWQQENWAGRFIVRHFYLDTRVFSPAIAYRVNPSFSVGAGLIVGNTSVEYSRSLPYRDQNRESFIQLESGSTGVGFSISAYYVAGEKLGLGLQYRSKLNNQFSEPEIRLEVPASLRNEFYGQSSATIALNNGSFFESSGSWKVSDRVDIGIGATLFLPSHENRYIITSSQENAAIPNYTTPFNFQYETTYRLGLSYTFSEYFGMRAGTFYTTGNYKERSISPQKPYNQHMAFTGGLSFNAMDSLDVDFGFVFIFSGLQEGFLTSSNFGGTYKSRVYLPGISISYFL